MIDRTKCISCGLCTEVCFAEALALSGRELTVGEIMREVVQDMPYYRESGGGVTLSGGEVLCQRDFALELIRECNSRGINTALETNLHFDFEEIREILGSVALIMCDLKLFDGALHREYTGVGNEKIIANIARLDELGIPCIVRTPLIPDVTDTPENLTAIAGFLRSRKSLVRWELLNFNPLGGEKYRSLGLENRFSDTRPLSRARLDGIAALVGTVGVEYKII